MFELRTIMFIISDQRSQAGWQEVKKVKTPKSRWRSHPLLLTDSCPDLQEDHRNPRL